MINIKKNDYIENTEIREEVVQAICDAFLYKCTWSVFHPHNEFRRYATLYVVGDENGFYGFMSKKLRNNDITYKIRKVEMIKAFKELMNAGYYMFKVYSYGTWMGYRLSETPYMEGGTRVNEFDDEF